MSAHMDWRGCSNSTKFPENRNSQESQTLHENLKPFVNLISAQYIEFLDKLNYPIRIGEHNNTAFGMSFAYDFAKKYDPKLAAKIEEKTKQYFLDDCGCPPTWEPGGFDFLSPCLQEAALMQKVLGVKEFKKWFKDFLPGFEKNPGKFMEIAIVTDRSDGKLAHLDGLNYSRAWCLFEIGKALNNQKMIDLGKQHFKYSYYKMDPGEYAGEHWLASFATYALIKYSGKTEKQINTSTQISRKLIITYHKNICTTTIDPLYFFKISCNLTYNLFRISSQLSFDYYQ